MHWLTRALEAEGKPVCELPLDRRTQTKVQCDPPDEPCDTFQRTGYRGIRWVSGAVILGLGLAAALIFTDCSGKKREPREPPHLGFNYTSNNSYVSR